MIQVEELEALVGHLYVVGRRPVSVTPPGALVQLAPKRAPRSRESDAFFTLVLPAEGSAPTALFFERMAHYAAENYFSSGGNIATALRAMLTRLNNSLLEHNEESDSPPFYADVVCMVLHGQEVYIARTGGALALLWQRGRLHSFPEDLQDPSLQEGQPLGYSDSPEVEVTQYRVQAGDVIALTDDSFMHIPRMSLATLKTDEGVQYIVTQLKALRPPETAAMIAQFITPDMPDPEPVKASLAPAASAPMMTAAAPGTTPAAAKPATSTADATKPAGERSGLRGLSQRIGRGRNFKPNAPLDVSPGLTERIPSLPELRAGGEHLLRRGAGRGLRLLHGLVMRLAGLLGGVGRVMDRSIPEPEAGERPSLPTPLAMGIAILIPVAVVVLVVALTFLTDDQTDFERCLAQFGDAVGGARIADENDLPDAKDYWTRAWEASLRSGCEKRTNDPTYIQLRAEVQGRLDDFDQVSRCPITPLRQYERGADLRGPVLQADVDVYVLDTVRSTIYRETLNERGNLLVGESQVVVRGGQALGDYVVDDLVDIAWLTEGGVSVRSALIALDARGGALLSYSPLFPPARVQALIGADLWIRPVAIATWQGRLYILDPPANQVWRYVPSGGVYGSAPEEYFIGDSRPDLSNAVDLAIDENGSMYVLTSDGFINKFSSGESLLFQFAQLPSHLGGSLGSASAMYLDLGRLRPGFWVLDAPNNIIYELTVAGTFLNSYRAPNDIGFRSLSGLVVDSTSENVYVVAWNTLLHLQKCDD